MSYYLAVNEPRVILGPFNSYVIEELSIHFYDPENIIGWTAIGYMADVDWHIINTNPPGPLDGYEWDWDNGVWKALPPPLATQAQKDAAIATINTMRDVKIDGGFSFRGKLIQSRQTDQINIISLKGLAQDAISAAVQENGNASVLVDNYRWVDTDVDFAFITADNTTINLDAFGMIELFQTGVAFKLGLTNYARSLKDAIVAAITTVDLAAIDIVNGWP